MSFKVASSQRRVALALFTAVVGFGAGCRKGRDSHDAPAAADCSAPAAAALTDDPPAATDGGNEALIAGVIATGTAEIDDLKTDLSAAGLSDDQVTIIAGMADQELATKAGTIAVDETGDVAGQSAAAAATPVAQGALKALDDPCAGLASAEARAAVAKTVVSSTVVSMADKTQSLEQGAVDAAVGNVVGGAVQVLPEGGLGADATAEGLRVTDGASPLSQGLDAVTNGAVGALQRAGYAAAEIGPAAQKAAGAAVAALGSAGASSDDVGGLAGSVASAAIRGLADAGLTADEIVQTKSIAQIVSGATAAVSAAGVAGDQTSGALGAIASAAVSSLATAGFDSAELKSSALADVVGGAMDGAQTLSPNDAGRLADAMTTVAKQVVATIAQAGFAAADVAAATSTIVQAGVAKIAELGIKDTSAVIAISSKIMEGALAGVASLASSHFITADQTKAVAVGASSGAVQALTVLQQAGLVSGSDAVASFNSGITKAATDGLTSGGVDASVVASVKDSVGTTLNENPATPTVATPAFSVAAGTYASAQTVTLTCATAGATIYYTTDGSAPSEGSSRFTAAITLSASATLKALAKLVGAKDSAVATAAYTIVLAPAAPSGLGVTAGVGQNDLAWSAVAGADGYKIYWSTTGSPTTASSSIASASASYSHTGLTAGTTYYYVVTALRGGRESAPSGVASGTPQALPAAAMAWAADSLTGSDGSTVTTWTDAIGGKNAVTFGEAPALALGAINGHKAVTFTGSTGLQVAAGDSAIAGATAFTIAVVFKPAQYGTNIDDQWYTNTGIVDAEEGGVMYDWGLAWTGQGHVGGGIGFSAGSDTTVYSGAAALATTHVAIYSWDGSAGTLLMNVDGAPSTMSTAANAPRDTYRFLIGNNANGSGLNGQIAEVRIYTQAFSAAQSRILGAALATTYGATWTNP